MLAINYAAPRLHDEKPPTNDDEAIVSVPAGFPFGYIDSTEPMGVYEKTELDVLTGYYTAA